MLAGIETSEDRKYHLTFKRRHKPRGKKTNVYKVINQDFTLLGLVRWHGAFRQYCFYPENDTMFSKGCLELINNFLDKVNNRYRKKLKKKKSGVKL